jgi:tungstate transport system ATP-binding protein
MTASVALRIVDGGVVFGSGSRQLAGLQGINLEIRAGERVALVGSNGSGKSTLLRLLHGLIQPSHGVVQNASTLRQAMVFQRPHLLRLSVQANVALGLWLAGYPWRKASAAAVPALARVGLEDLAQRNGRTLSGGEQQRVAMARALALAPDVLLLDEPTASLDPHAKREVELMMEQFCQRATSSTMVFASHNLGQVKRLASRVIYVEQGRVLADLPVGEFFDGDVLQNHYPQAYFFTQGEQA